MMEERSTLVRLAPFTGAVFVVLTVVGGLLGYGGIEWLSSGEDIAAHLQENSGRAWAGTIMMMLAPLFLLWFLGSLWQRMRAAEATPARLSVIMFGGGVVLAGAYVAGAGLLMGATGRASDGALSAPYAELAFDVAAILWSVGAAVALAVVLLSFAVLAARARTYPTWWVWVTAILAVAMLIIPIAWITVVGGLAWVLAMSLWLGLAGWRAAPAAPMAAG